VLLLGYDEHQLVRERQQNEKVEVEGEQDGIGQKQDHTTAV
jgi:hypothetical protein